MLPRVFVYGGAIMLKEIILQVYQFTGIQSEPINIREAIAQKPNVKDICFTYYTQIERKMLIDIDNI